MLGLELKCFVCVSVCVLSHGVGQERSGFVCVSCHILWVRNLTVLCVLLPWCGSFALDLSLCSTCFGMS